MNDEPFSHTAGVDVPEDVRRGVRHLLAGGSEGVVEADDFHKYENLERLDLREGTREIGRGAFRDCRRLRTVNSPSSLRTIGDQAFYGCWSLSETNLPEGLRSIGRSAFCYHCFRKITIPSSVVEIGDLAFAEGDVLKQVTLAGGAVMVGRNAFGGCPQLRNIAIPSKVIVVEDGEYGNGRVAVVTGGTIPLRRPPVPTGGPGRMYRWGPTVGPNLVILTSPYLASMQSEDDVTRVRDAINRTVGGRARGEGLLDLALGNADDWIRVREGADRIRSRFFSLLSAHRRAIAFILERAPSWESEGGGVEPALVGIILSFFGDVEG